MRVGRTRSWMLLIEAVCLSVLLRGGQEEASIGGQHYVYLSDKRISTVELISERKAILNYINLSDTVELIRAPELLVIDDSGRAYTGQLFVNENPDSTDPGRFRVSDLVLPRQYRGYDVLSDFRFEAAPSKVYLRLGGRLVEFQPVDREDFERFADRVGNIDLGEPNSKAAVMDAGFWQGFGNLIGSGTSEGQRISRLYPAEEPLPPRLLANPAPRLAGRFADLADPVVVKLKVLVTVEGGVVNPEVLESPNPELDDIAVQVVLNSWEFLPAVADNKPAQTELVHNVIFQR